MRGTDEVFDYDAQEPVLGESRFVRCLKDPNDTLAVCSSRGGPMGSVVMFRTATGNAELYTVLDTPTARVFAAAILNAADEADGTAPLLFHVPECAAALETERNEGEEQ